MNNSVIHIRCQNYWSFSFSISPSNNYSVLIYSTMGWLDLLAVQGTFKSLLQCHSSKASILRHSGFFIVQLSHPYVTTGKTIALSRWNTFGKVMSLLFSMLSRFVIAFLLRSKCLNFMAAVTICSDFEVQESKVFVSIVSPSICHEVMGLDAMIFIFWMFKVSFFTLLFHFIKRLFSSSSLSAISVVSSAYLRLLTFPRQSWFQLVLHPAWHFVWCTLHIS